MIEVECKLKIDSKDHIESMLKELGFKFVKTVYENDTYFDNEDGYVRNHDSALRIRVTKEPDINKTTTEVNFKCRYDDEMKAKLDDKLMEFKEAIENGDFEIGTMTPDEEKEICKYCKYGSICRRW